MVATNAIAVCPKHVHRCWGYLLASRMFHKLLGVKCMPGLRDLHELSGRIPLLCCVGQSQAA
eukprot:15448860-Alexandrium_andersonii.AAC.1